MNRATQLYCDHSLDEVSNGVGSLVEHDLNVPQLKENHLLHSDQCIIFSTHLKWNLVKHHLHIHTTLHNMHIHITHYICTYTLHITYAHITHYICTHYTLHMHTLHITYAHITHYICTHYTLHMHTLHITYAHITYAHITHYTHMYIRHQY